MAYVADLHIHSRFSRACSQELNIPNLAHWSKLKGIDLTGTGDFLHPLWFAELKHKLIESPTGIHTFEGHKFLLTNEISCIYSDKGKVRRIHILVFLPSFDAVAKLSQELIKRGVNLSSDGRPILGMSARALCEIIFSLEPKAIIIPAHCILPDTLIHTEEGMKPIADIKIGDLVYTHENRKRKVLEIIKHNHTGRLFKIQPWYFAPGLEATGEHPFLAFKTKRCLSTGDKCLPTKAHKKVCKHRLFEKYKPEWIKAEDLESGDILVYPRFTNTTPMPMFPMEQVLNRQAIEGLIYTGGTRGRIFESNLRIDENFCRLIGYYLAEGWVTAKAEVGFCFNSKEIHFIEDVKILMEKVFGITHSRIYKRPNSKGTEIIFASKIISELFAKIFYTKTPLRAQNKTVPDWILHLPTNFQAQILLGWWRGDAGYTSSRSLMNQIKVICLRLGLIPSIGLHTAKDHNLNYHANIQGRVIKATSDMFHFSYLAFFEDKFNLLSDPIFVSSKRKLSRKHGWIDRDYIYIPIRKVTSKEFRGEVFNLEVEEDHSYITEFAAVHNCWTPWFSLFGSQSGYDFFKECFGEFSDQVFAIETGLSSEPAMNWRISDLDQKSIVSFSDSHSLPRLGREVTIFKGNCTFDELRDDLINQNIHGTIEFFPEEGKYHYSGHRNCNVVLDPVELKKQGEICPKCKRRLTIGVMTRVEELATRSQEELKLKKENGVTKSDSFPNRPGFRMLVALDQIIAESLGVASVSSQKVKDMYIKLVTNIDNELKILTKTPLDLISMVAGEKIAEGVARVREAKLSIEPGFDNTYGKVKIWGEEEGEKAAKAQISFFDN